MRICQVPGLPLPLPTPGLRESEDQVKIPVETPLRVCSGDPGRVHVFCQVISSGNYMLSDPAVRIGTDLLRRDVDSSSIFRSVHIVVATDTGEQDGGVAGAGESPQMICINRLLVDGTQSQTPGCRFVCSTQPETVQRNGARRSNSSPAESVVLREASPATSRPASRPQPHQLQFLVAGCAWVPELESRSAHRLPVGGVLLDESQRWLHRANLRQDGQPPNDGQIWVGKPSV
ncbi:hypothetical protein QBC47DRAFT_200007 [Echria macrotheca]|uniref:Uncharacterized protein n=1 Tax=Echria macrotheca TaxID=438768 RepID=A0AAJ0FBZ8_9PEZI|nr:hypothetical protein QBC47DRAFT_200007 [Echria macrotheca]